MKSIYLKLTGPDLKGESADKDHDQWIEITSWAHAIAQPKSGAASTSGGHTAERTEHGDMVFVKDLDSASPLLYQAVSGGTTFQGAQIEFFRDAGDGKRVKYLEIQLKNVLIARIEPKIDGTALPFETMSLKYAAVQWKYQKQNIDGGQGGITQGAWSLTKNDKTFAV